MSNLKIDTCPFCGKAEKVDKDNILVACVHCAFNRACGLDKSKSIAGKDIFKLRKELKISRFNAAKEMGVSPSHLSEVEREIRAADSRFFKWYKGKIK